MAEVIAHPTTNRVFPSTWKPRESFVEVMQEAIELARDRLFDVNAQPLNDQWIADNFENLLKRFAEGHDQRSVAGLMGLPWSDWADLTQRSSRFRQVIELGIQLRLSVFEEMRNSACRGEHRGSVAAITHALDRQHADAYFGRPGTYSPDDDVDEMTLDQAQQVLESYGLQKATSD